MLKSLTEIRRHHAREIGNITREKNTLRKKQTNKQTNARKAHNNQKEKCFSQAQDG